MRHLVRLPWLLIVPQRAPSGLTPHPRHRAPRPPRPGVGTATPPPAGAQVTLESVCGPSPLRRQHSPPGGRVSPPSSRHRGVSTPLSPPPQDIATVSAPATVERPTAVLQRARPYLRNSPAQIQRRPNDVSCAAAREGQVSYKATDAPPPFTAAIAPCVAACVPQTGREPARPSRG